MSLLIGACGGSVGVLPLNSTAAISAVHVLREARSSTSRALPLQRADPLRRDALCNFSSSSLAVGTFSYMSDQEILASRSELRSAGLFRRAAAIKVPHKLPPQLQTILSTNTARRQRCYSTTRGSTFSAQGNDDLKNHDLSAEVLQRITEALSNSSNDRKDEYKRAQALLLEVGCIQIPSEGLIADKLSSDEKQKQPWGYGQSLIGYWRKIGGIDQQVHMCAVEGCCEEVKEGGQVMVKATSGFRLPMVTGMCQSHNRTGRNHTYPLKLRPDAVLVPMPGSTGWTADHVHELYRMKEDFSANMQQKMNVTGR